MLLLQKSYHLATEIAVRVWSKCEPPTTISLFPSLFKHLQPCSHIQTPAWKEGAQKLFLILLLQFPWHSCMFPCKCRVQKRCEKTCSVCADKKIFASMVHVQYKERREEREAFLQTQWLIFHEKCKGGWTQGVIWDFIFARMRISVSGCRHFADSGGVELGWQNGLLHCSRHYTKEAVRHTDKGKRINWGVWRGRHIIYDTLI